MAVKIARSLVETRQSTGGDRHVEVSDPALVSTEAGTGVERTIPGAIRILGAAGRTITCGCAARITVGAPAMPTLTFHTGLAQHRRSDQILRPDLDCSSALLGPVRHGSQRLGAATWIES